MVLASQEHLSEQDSIIFGEMLQAKRLQITAERGQSRVQKLLSSTSIADAIRE